MQQRVNTTRPRQGSTDEFIAPMSEGHGDLEVGQEVDVIEEEETRRDAFEKKVEEEDEDSAFVKKRKGLNKSFYKWVCKQFAENKFSDWTIGVQDYITHMKKLKQKRDKNTTTTTSNGTSQYRHNVSGEQWSLRFHNEEALLQEEYLGCGLRKTRSWTSCSGRAGPR